MVLRRELIQTVRAATATEDTRYALHAIQVRPDGEVVATNGHVLIRATDSSPIPDADFPVTGGDNPTGNVLLDGEQVKRFLDVMPKDKRTVEVFRTLRLATVNGATYAMVPTGVGEQPMLATIPNEGEFPAYEKVLPKKDRPVVTVVLGIEVLQTLIKSATAAGTKSIRFAIPTGQDARDGEQGDVNTACLATYQAPGGVRAEAVVMPMRA